jgi:hypothetical protein
MHGGFEITERVGALLAQVAAISSLRAPASKTIGRNRVSVANESSLSRVDRALPE